MSDFLESVRQALEWWEAHLGETGPVSNDLHRLNQIVLADAAGRLVRLAETGPDYEAARRAFEREFPCHCGPAFTERDRHASDCVFDESDSVVPIVDAAVPWLSDYTEEE